MTDVSLFRSALAQRAQAVEAFLDSAITPNTVAGETVRPERLVAAMRHGVLNGGKRLRPFLVMECNALLGGVDDAALAIAAAVECVHCYSLIHDDLPAMDDDDLRRGVPTVHVAFDEATAILAGDALLTLSFDLAGRRPAGLCVEKANALVVALARAAGLGGMAGGQMLDLQHEHGAVDPAMVETIHAMKTGALIRFSCEAGAIVARPDARETMRRLGAILGLAFQLADDLLDVTADAAAMGKATGKDAAAGKQTLVGLHGVDWARQRLDALVSEADALLAPFGDKAETLRQAAHFIAHRGY
ncbi:MULTISPECIES: polyprenyl synthetase family protein [unclassified Roseitalea]|uniref:polyprenyl synthetase family protein n=1 Tax=unclassified Roseitalea TaxID=2639107 RepID=UPI00273FE135|nr:MULTISPECIES: farnesyl diphosphate synthase [unclassified Roseitalea]